jgi:hypothetical protein
LGGVENRKLRRILGRSKIIRWTGHFTHMEKYCIQFFSPEKCEEGNHFEDLDIDGRAI